MSWEGRVHMNSVYEHLIYNARVTKLMASFQVGLVWICSGVSSPKENLAQLF